MRLLRVDGIAVPNARAYTAVLAAADPGRDIAIEVGVPRGARATGRTTKSSPPPITVMTAAARRARRAQRAGTLGRGRSSRCLRRLRLRGSPAGQGTPGASETTEAPAA
eukprot:gene18451-17022_t